MNERLQPVPEDAGPDRQALMDGARAASDLLKALSHETRLLILCLLSDGEKSVSDLVADLGLPQAVVSQHLARLRFDRIVTARRAGRQMRYCIAEPKAGAVVRTLTELFCPPGRTAS